MQLSRLLTIIFFSSTIFWGLSQSSTQQFSRHQLLQLYKEADKLYKEGEEIVNRRDYTEAKEEKLNRDALTAYYQLEKIINDTRTDYDSLMFYVYFKTGVLEHYFDNSEKAKTGYTKTIELKKKLPQLNDTLLFNPYLYLGIILYNENYFDSSLTIYKKAERIADESPSPLTESQRLYNTLGALYYETGNFRQAKNYIEKSLAILSPSNPYFKELAVNYKINLATILTKLEDFEEANRIYKEILPLNINRDIILHNTGVINMKLGAITTALDYFRKVNYTDSRKTRLYNDIALAYMNIRKNDSATYFLEKAIASDTATDKKTVVRGQTHQYRADLLLSENKTKEALQNYQQAILNYYPAYNESDVYKNPTSFSGVFSYIYLFNTLTSKAEAFENLYLLEKSKSYLEASLNAYRSAFALADYVERSYDSDEARLFLNKIKYGVHSKPIDVSLRLFELTKDESYIEQAWQFDQMNKASILSFNVFENEIRDKVYTKNERAREKEIKTAITRLSLQAANETRPEKLKEINEALRDYEIVLGKIQDSVSGKNKIRSSGTAIPSVKWLQDNLLDKNTALLSYHLSEKELLIICFSKNSFEYKKIPVSDSFFTVIDSFVYALHNVDEQKKFNASAISQHLYNWLITPVFAYVKNMNRLIIIPDDELNYIPFDALQDANGKYIAQQFAVQYQYSASLLEKKKKNYADPGILSFAPFANTKSNYFDKLSYSADEIKNLSGKQFVDGAATKENFLHQANKYAVIHLATHARAYDKQPQQSFIAFAGNDTDSVTSRLYAQEIYDLSLDSTRLVVLSACETGTGQLVQGEGLMSLSRAFAYAGCSDIVTSLWKAEDKTTAFITRRFHFYRNNKKTTDQALQLAKLDLLNSSEIDERLKTPNYWAHIIFIGEYEPASFSFFKWWMLIPFFLIPIFWFFYRRQKKA